MLAIFLFILTFILIILLIFICCKNNLDNLDNYNNLDINSCKDLCNKAYPKHSSHDPVTYYSACLNYCSTGFKHSKDKKYLCNYCRDYALPYSGYNTACQYFSGKFIDKTDKCYGKTMSICSDFEWNPKCSK